MDAATKNFLAWAKSNVPDYYAMLVQELAQQNIVVTGLGDFSSIATLITNIASNVAGTYASISNSLAQQKAIQAQIDYLKQQQSAAAQQQLQQIAQQQQAQAQGGTPGAPASGVPSTSGNNLLVYAGLALLVVLLMRNSNG